MTIRPLLLLACLFLSACAAPQAVELLPGDEVLRRAVLASQRLESAAFSMTLDATVVQLQGEMDTDATFAGVLQHGGQAIQSSIDATITLPSAEGTQQIQVVGEAIVLGERETYLRVEDLSLPEGLLPLPSALVEGFAGDTWWKVGTGNAGTAAEQMTPDHQLIQGQAEVVVITRELGVEDIAGRPAYHYAVRLDRQKLMDLLRRQGQQNLSDFENVAAEGELWVDAETFYLSKAVWHVSDVTTAQGTLSADVIITLSQHDHAQSVMPPAESQPLPLGIGGFAIFGQSAPLPLPPNVGDTVQP